MKSYFLCLLVLMFFIQGCSSSQDMSGKQNNLEEINPNNIIDLSNKIGYEIDLDADYFKMYDGDNGWIATTVPDFGVFITKDGGQDWLEVTPKEVNNGILYTLDKDISFIVSNLNNEKIIYRTNDQGNTWSSYPIMNSKSDVIYSVSFIDPNNGWLTGQLKSEGSYNTIEILRTSDGGETWNSVNSASELNLGYKNGAILSAPKVGWVTASISGGPLVYHTSDNGEVWKNFRLSEYSNIDYFSEPSNPFIVNENTVIIPVKITKEGTSVLSYYYTVNGGVNWLASSINLDVPKENQNLLFDATDLNHSWQTTDGSNFYILTNKLSNIESINLQEMFKQNDLKIINFSFVTPSEGFMIIRALNKTLLISTTTGGRSWE